MSYKYIFFARRVIIISLLFHVLFFSYVSRQALIYVSCALVNSFFLPTTYIHVSTQVVKKSMCKTKRKKMIIVTRTHQEKDVLRITLSLISILFFASNLTRMKTKTRIKSPMTIHLSFIDNRDVITTTTDFDTSNNIYEMVRKIHLFFSRKILFFFLRQLFNIMKKVFKPILEFDKLVQ